MAERPWKIKALGFKKSDFRCQEDILLIPADQGVGSSGRRTWDVGPTCSFAPRAWKMRLKTWFARQVGGGTGRKRAGFPNKGKNRWKCSGSGVYL